jgi:hypothetical protein
MANLARFLSRDPKQRSSRARVLAIVGLAALLRLIHANTEFWFDEIVTAQYFVRPPFGRIISTYGIANNHVLNSLLPYWSVSVGGTEPWVIVCPRFCSALPASGRFALLRAQSGRACRPCWTATLLIAECHPVRAALVV